MRGRFSARNIICKAIIFYSTVALFDTPEMRPPEAFTIPISL